MRDANLLLRRRGDDVEDFTRHVDYFFDVDAFGELFHRILRQRRRHRIVLRRF